MKKSVVLLLALLFCGLCAAGADSCADTDGGPNYYQVGVCTYSYGLPATAISAAQDVTSQKVDECVIENGPWLREYYCGNYSVRYRSCDSEEVRCPETYECRKGACAEKNTTIQPSPRCSDSDGGPDLFTQGTCSTGVIKHTDGCIAGKVYEFDCKGTKGDGCYGHLESCPEGHACAQGRCVRAEATALPPIIACIDSDGGLNYSVKGTCRDYANASGRTDSCSGGTLTEWYCSTKLPKLGCTSQAVKCSGGTACSNGACVRQETNWLNGFINWLSRLFG